MIASTTLDRIRLHRLLTSLLIGAVALALLADGLIATVSAQPSAETSQQPTSETVEHPFGRPSEPLAERHVYDFADVLSPNQRYSVERDATRLQRHGLPALVVTVTSSMSEQDAESVAAAVRHDWHVETGPGADDGLVVLLVLPRTDDDPAFAALSWGDNALPTGGITWDVARRIENAWIVPRLTGEPHPFEALTYGLRRLVYYAIYVPEPVASLSATQKQAQDLAIVIAPMVAAAALAVLYAPDRGGGARRSGTGIRAHRYLGAIAVTAALAAFSVWAHSTVGVACTLIALAALAWRWVCDDPTSDRRPALVARLHFSQVAVPAAIVLASLAINLAHVAQTDTHPDESRWINRAHYASDLTAPFSLTWEDQYLTRGQPPLGSYLTGFALLLQGRDTVTNNVWDFSYGSDWNRSVGAMASDEDRSAVRRANAVVGAVTVLLVYIIGATLAGPIAGAAGALMLALHPLQVLISTQALSDQLFALLVAATVLVAIRLGRHPSRGVALTLGVLLGLGGAVKLSPLLLALPIAGYGLGLVLLVRTSKLSAQRATAIGRYLLWQPVIAFATFVIVYPYLWPAPLRRTWNLFALRAREMEGQSNAWPEAHVETPLHAIARIFEMLTVEASTTGNILGWLGDLLSLDVAPWGIDMLLAVVGAVILARLCLRHGPASGTSLAAVVLGGQVAAIVAGMRVDFYRYHLPVVVAVCVLTGLTIQMVWQRYVAPRLNASTEASGAGANRELQAGGNR